MRRPYKLCLSILLLGVGAAAQHSNGYVFGGFGSVSGGGGSTLQVGVGGEAVFLRYVGIGGEAGALAPTSDFGAAIAVLSANGYGHIPTRGKWDPFLTAGYSRLQRTGGVNAFNYGGGVNYWFKRHLGLRMEFRDHVASEGSNTHFWTFRFGLGF